MAVSIRIDPWAADYDGAPAVDEDEGPGGAVDWTVETTEWEAITPDDVPRPACMAFVDGVQRTEARVVCDGDGKLSYGALASIGVGCALLENGAARLKTEQPVRALALTDGEMTDPIDVPCGRLVLQFKPWSLAASGPAAVADGIHEARRDAETKLSAALVEDGCPFVVVDGRLSFLPTRRTAVVGLIKTIRQQYLAVEQRALLGTLLPGTRTPLFRIPRDRSLYSWYVRLAAPRRIDHAWAGLVRVETLETVGLENAIRVANVTARWLPAFASTPAWDARAPQNLFPICALEQRLHHELGDRLWIRTAIEMALAQEVSRD